VSQSTVPPISAAPQGRPRSLFIASVLCWLEGLLFAFGSAWDALENFGRPAALVGLAVFVVALALCVAGYMLRQARRTGGSIAVLGAGLLSLGLLNDLLHDLRLGALQDAPVTVGVLALNIAIVALVGRNWRQLRPPRGHVGA
jgi:hypothetical protein